MAAGWMVIRTKGDHFSFATRRVSIVLATCSILDVEFMFLTESPAVYQSRREVISEFVLVMHNMSVFVFTGRFKLKANWVVDLYLLLKLCDIPGYL